jgi:hypothetical protein
MQAEGSADQQQEQQHQQGMVEADFDEQGRGRQSHQCQHHALGHRRADIGDDRLEAGDGRRQKFINGANKLREVYAEAGIKDRLHEHGEQGQAVYDEAAEADPLHVRHVAADGGAEDDEIEGGGDDRRHQALPQRPPGPRHLEAVDGRHAVDVHAAFPGAWTSWTKMSSRLDWRVERSL